MYKFFPPNFPHTPYDDFVDGYNGCEGWVSDSLYKDTRVIFLYGAWGQRDAISCANVTMQEDAESGFRFHGGFLNLANRVWPDLKKHFRTPKKIVFAGHSMGGAIASILAMKYYMTFGVKAGLDLYGTPPLLGDSHTVNIFKSIYPNMVCHYVGLDIVAHLSYIGWWLGYKKPWKNLYYNNGDNKLPWYRFYRRLFADHEPQEYINHIPEIRE